MREEDKNRHLGGSESKRKYAEYVASKKEAERERTERGNARTHLLYRRMPRDLVILSQ